MKYCKCCGSSLDDDKKCTGCGKQYFNFNIKTLKTILALTFTLFLIYATMGTISTISSLENQIHALNTTIENLNNEKDVSVAELSKYKKAVVFLTPSGGKYHMLGCSHISSSTKYLAANETLAQALGYSPCSRCMGPEHTYIQRELPQAIKKRILDEYSEAWNLTPVTRRKPTYEEIMGISPEEKTPPTLEEIQANREEKGYIKK